MPSKRTVQPPSSASTSTSAQRPTTPTAPVTTTSSSALSSGPKTLSANSSVYEIASHVWQQYLATTPQRTMLLDTFMGFLVLVGGVQFAYCVLAGNYPFNAFLSGFCAAVGQFVLTASLRMQMSDGEGKTSGTANKNKGASKSGKAGGGVGKQGEGDSGVSHERAFADYIFGSLILHFFCINFIN